MIACDFVLRRALVAVALSAAAAVVVPARADPVAEFYAGKTLSIVSGFTPNGENDTYIRLLGRHIGKRIPGRPFIVNSNMPGAGTLIAANNLYAKATPDGLALATFTAQAAVEPWLENKAANFDPQKLNWIGSMSQDLQFCAIRPGPGVPVTFDELRRAEAVFGSSMPSSDIYRATAVVRNVLGAKIRMITGYAGMPAVNLALARGEVSGVCGYTPLAMRTQFADDLASGRLRLLVQMGNRTTREFGDVPSVFDFPVSPGDRALLEFFFRALALGRPIAAPPGTPADRVAALRAAFDSTLRDADFLAEAGKLNLSIDPATAAEIEGQMKSLAALPREFFRQVQKVAE